MVTPYEIVAVPPVTPSTRPVDPTVATDGVPLLQLPPAVASVSVVLAPAHNTPVPETVPALGAVLTDTTRVAAAVPQLFVTVYDIVVVPAATPDTIPDVPTVALAVLVLLHVPPAAASVSVTLLPIHTADGPDIVPATADGLTVTITEVKQPPVTA